MPTGPDNRSAASSPVRFPSSVRVDGMHRIQSRTGFVVRLDALEIMLPRSFRHVVRFARNAPWTSSMVASRTSKGEGVVCASIALVRLKCQRASTQPQALSSPVGGSSNTSLLRVIHLQHRAEQDVRSSSAVVPARQLERRVADALTLGTKIMPIGESCAIICASCPAPLGIRWLARPSRPALRSIARCTSYAAFAGVL